MCWQAYIYNLHISTHLCGGISLTSEADGKRDDSALKAGDGTRHTLRRALSLWLYTVCVLKISAWLRWCVYVSMRICRLIFCVQSTQGLNQRSNYDSSIMLTIFGAPSAVISIDYDFKACTQSCRALGCSIKTVFS